MIIVDTNVVSELIKVAPDVSVEQWAGGRRTTELHTTSITVAEIRYGIERLPAGRRRTALEVAAIEVFRDFGDRVLPFDRAAATPYASIVAGRERAGSPIHISDAQIAAICRVHGASLATRNIRDFRGAGIELINPWETSG